MEFYEGMRLKIKKTGLIYELLERVHNIYHAPAWIVYRFPLGNVIEGKALMFEDTLNEHIQNNEVEIIEKR